MKRKISTRFLAWMLMLCMLISMAASVMAEEPVSQPEDSQGEISATLRMVDLSADHQEELSTEEAVYYQQVLEEMGDQETLTVQDDDATLVYTVMDTGDEEAVVLQEYTYSAGDQSGLPLVSYSEIVLNSEEPEQEAAGDLPSEEENPCEPEECEESCPDISPDSSADAEETDDQAEDAATVDDEEIDIRDLIDEDSEFLSEETDLDAAFDESETEADEAEAGQADEAEAEPADSESAQTDTPDPEESDEASDPADEPAAMVNDETFEQIAEPEAVENVEASEEVAEHEAMENVEASALVTEPETVENVEASAQVTEPEAETVADVLSQADESETVEAVPAPETEEILEPVSFASTVPESEEICEPVSFASADPETAEDTGKADILAETASDSVNTYHASDDVRVTAEQLLQLVQNGDEMAIGFAESMGFGRKAADQIDNLSKIVEEYKAHPDYTEPAFIIKDVALSLDKEIAEDEQDGVAGYRTTISVDSSAMVEIEYDERGETKIIRKVKTDKATDFIITLDVSGSMNDYGRGRDNAMFSALKVILDEILLVPENTVSIIFWADNAAVMRLDVDQDGIMETTFSGEGGYTADMIYDSPMVSESGVVSGIVLSEGYNVISKIENFYHTSSGTEPDHGLDQAIALLDAVGHSEDRNLGVMLFTDGAANRTASERRTVVNEKELAEQYGAKIVNVSIGNENQVKQYERYLDPASSSYYEPDNPVLQEKVLYYNIPNLSNEELAERVTEMFDIAFEDITTETHELKSETVTRGILAAVAAKVIETVPAGFQVVTADGLTYTVEGVDEKGSTIISFSLDDLVSQGSESLCYFAVPTDADHDIGITAYSAEAGTTLYAEPIDKMLQPEDQRGIQIVYQSNGELLESGKPSAQSNDEDSGSDTEEIHLVSYTVHPMAYKAVTIVNETEEYVISKEEAADLLNFLYGKEVVHKPWWFWEKTYSPRAEVKDYFDLLTGNCTDKSSAEIDKIKREFLIAAESLLSSRMSLNRDMLQKRTERLISYAFNIEADKNPSLFRKAMNAKGSYDTWSEELIVEITTEMDDDVNPLEIISEIYKACTGKSDLKLNLHEKGAFYVSNGSGSKIVGELHPGEWDSWTWTGKGGKQIELCTEKYTVATKTDSYSFEIEEADFSGAEFMLELMDTEKWDAYLNACFTLANIVESNNNGLVYERWQLLRENDNNRKNNTFNSVVASAQDDISKWTHEMNTVKGNADVYAAQLYSIEKSLMINH